ncbi:uncharacterized protein E5676_scaffold110G002400 [Cucumis melo var. makuwa]|uniref:Uncharacterized protein n=1 Tax=Cucumis melo var. makuwa TaxID=1194695 RepID=A0A5D3B9X4_CUCMM|nr:uncharacterized protein E6C27_scaffold20G001750 [Cucumis melo var. makuwa]TYJ95927.1 uncharacterized protein E5676_scaffold110G002400 [Cucumis melo var. makuwa]
MPQTFDGIQRYLFADGICPSYGQQIYHGELANFAQFERVITPLAPLVDDELVGDRLREQSTIENDDNELFNLLNDLQGLTKEGTYDEDGEDFRDEMHKNTEQRYITNIFEELMDDVRNLLYPSCTKFSSLNFLVKLMHVKVVHILGWKYHFTPEITSCFLRPTDPLLNNWFKVQPINLNPSGTNKKVGPLVQDLDSVLKGTTYLLSQKWVGVNFVLHLMFLAIHSVLSMKWEAYWASEDEFPSPMQI